MKRLVCILLIIAFVCGGCASSPKIASYSWEPIVVTSPKPGKPFLSDQLIEQTDLIIADIEESLDYAEIETKAEADLVLRGLYGTHMMHSGNLKVAASKAKRNNAMVYGDSLDIISNLKSIEGRLLMEQKDFVSPALSAADRFDETVGNFENMFLKLSQQEKTSVELVAFLMGAERVFSASRVWGDAARMEAERANLTYASLRLALHSVIAGKLLEKVNDELGIIPTDALRLPESDLPRIMD